MCWLLGGALVDSSGKLIGICGRQGAENVGFAISIDSARTVIDEIRGNRRTSPVGSASRSPRSTRVGAVQVGLEPSTRGAAVTAVFAGSRFQGGAARATSSLRSTAGGALGRRFAQTWRLAPGASMTLDVVDQSGPRRVTVVGKRPPRCRAVERRALTA
jgi:S1-C subfamily serine protease